MKLKVLVVDDEPLAVALVRSHLAGVADVEIVASASDGEEASALIAELKPHVVLSDIRMPRQGGLTLARALQENTGVDVIFITAFDHFALQAFDLEVVDYILKPVQRERLVAALDKARIRRAGRGRRVDESTHQLEGFWIPTSKGAVWVPLLAVDWIEAARDYVMLHTATASHILRSTMDALEQQLDPGLFMRISRSAIVRLNAVDNWQRQGSVSMMAIMQGGLAVKVGGKYTRQVQTYAG